MSRVKNVHISNLGHTLHAGKHPSRNNLHGYIDSAAAFTKYCSFGLLFFSPCTIPICASSSVLFQKSKIDLMTCLLQNNHNSAIAEFDCYLTNECCSFG